MISCNLQVKVPYLREIQVGAKAMNSLPIWSMYGKFTYIQTKQSTKCR